MTDRSKGACSEKSCGNKGKDSVLNGTESPAPLPSIADSHQCVPLGRSTLLLWSVLRWPPGQHALRTDVFINVGPVNTFAITDDFEA